MTRIPDSLLGAAAVLALAGVTAWNPALAAVPKKFDQKFSPAYASSAIHVNNLSYDHARHSLVLDITGQVTIGTRSLKNPPRLVVDIPAASLESHNRELEIHDDMIQRVRISQWKIVPPTVRVVIQTATAVEPLIAVQQTGAKLYITLAPSHGNEDLHDAATDAASPVPLATPKPVKPSPKPHAKPSPRPTPGGRHTPLPISGPEPTAAPRRTPAPWNPGPVLPWGVHPSPLTHTRLVPHPKHTPRPTPRPTPTPMEDVPSPGALASPEPLPDATAPVLELPQATPTPRLTPDPLLDPSPPPESESLPRVP